MYGALVAACRGRARGNPVICTALAATVPVLGSELVTGWTTGPVINPLETLTTAGLVITSAINTVASGSADTNGMAVVTGTWYQATITPTINSGTGPFSDLRTLPNIEGTYRRSLWAGALTSGAKLTTFQSAQTETQYWSEYVVDVPTNWSATGVSFKAVTLASTLRLAGNSGVKNGIYRCRPTVAAGTQAGMAVCVDDASSPTYGLFLWTNRTNVTLRKLVAGVWSTLIDTATGVTYAAGRQLRLGIVGSTVTVYYESAAGVLSQIGTPQTVDLSSFGTRVCGLDPSGLNSVGMVEVEV